MEVYDPSQPPGPKQWLALTESERAELVQEFHADALQELEDHDPDEAVSRNTLHTTIHVVVETHLAQRIDPVRMNELISSEPGDGPALTASSGRVTALKMGKNSSYGGSRPHRPRSCVQPILLAANSADQSSGGLPRSSILAKITYGSDLLPADRKVSSSFTQA